jgi:integrase
VCVTLFQRKPGYWRLRCHQRDLVDITKYVHAPTREAAALAAKQWQAELERSGRTALSPKKPLGDWIRAHLQMQPHLSERTLDWYRGTLLRFIDPPKPTAAERRRRRVAAASTAAVDPHFNIGRRQIGRITAADGISFLRWMQDTHHGRHRTIHAAFHLARAALAEAARLGAIPHNPWEKIRKTQTRPPPIKVPSQTEQRRIGVIAEGRAELQLLLDLALGTGARRAELLALRWRNVDLTADPPTLTITGALQQRAGVITLKAPKTAAGARTVSLPATLAASLRGARALAAERALAGRLILDDLPVLPDAADPTAWWSPDLASQQARRALHAAGINISLHALRHAHASELLRRRISPRAVQHRLGHSSPAVTLTIYAHAIPEDDVAAAEAMNRALARG